MDTTKELRQKYDTHAFIITKEETSFWQ